MARKALRDHIVTGKVRQGYEAGIQGSCTPIKHAWLRTMIARRMADPAIPGLIGTWRHAEVTEHGGIARPAAGTPQGGPLSPCLAHVSLHDVLDYWCAKRAKKDRQGEAYLPCNDVPLNAANTRGRVNFIEYWEQGADKVQHFRWVTDIRVSTRNVYHLMRRGRARWKIENETCNTLKNQGSHFEHNYGHGEQHLSVVFAILLLLAFLVDQAQQLWCALCQAVWAKLGSKRLLWERMRALFYDYAFTSMRQLFEALLYGFKKSSPIVAIDSS